MRLEPDERLFLAQGSQMFVSITIANTASHVQQAWTPDQTLALASYYLAMPKRNSKAKIMFNI